MYAVIKTGGKQYRIEPDEIFAVEKLSAGPGDQVEFDQVALVEQKGKVVVGTPWVKGAKVTCRVLSQTRGRKIRVFNYKAKENIKRSRGHRQSYTQLKVEKITLRSRRKKEDSDGA